MKQSRTKDIFVLGFAMFAIFFGAGNLIFPPSIGISTGEDVVWGIAGMTLTGIIFPMLAMYAVVNMGTDFHDLSYHINSWWHQLFRIIGIFIVLFGIQQAGGWELVASWANVVFLAAFFALSYFFASNRSKVVDMIGAYATPILLIALLIIVVMVFAIPIGSPTGGTVEHAFSYSMLTAYNTGDIPTGLICAGVFLGSVKGKGYNTYKEQKYILVRSILVSLTILFVVYGGLCWLGACGTPYFAPDMDQTALLNGLVEMLAGRVSLVVLAIAVIFACFTTASGMIATVSDWIIEWTKGKVPYKIVAFVVTFIIFLVAATGVSNVLVISGPLFTLIFPMSVVMTVLGAVYMATLVSVYDAFVTARSSGLVSINTDALDSLIAMIPLSEYGFDWLIPTVIGFIVGAVIWKALGKESKPDAALSST